MAVAITLTKSAQKSIADLPAVMKARVAAKLAELFAYPNVSGVKALKGALKGQYRVRVGSHRILFTFENSIITIVAVDDRKESYG